MRVFISKSLYIYFEEDSKQLQLIRDDGEIREWFFIDKGDSKDLRQALHAIETGDLTDEEKAS
jgi:hypothetical protein